MELGYYNTTREEMDVQRLKENFRFDLIISLAVGAATLVVTFVLKNYLNNELRRDFAHDQEKQCQLQNSLLKGDLKQFEDMSPTELKRIILHRKHMKEECAIKANIERINKQNMQIAGVIKTRQSVKLSGGSSNEMESNYDQSSHNHYNGDKSQGRTSFHQNFTGVLSQNNSEMLKKRIRRRVKKNIHSSSQKCKELIHQVECSHQQELQLEQQFHNAGYEQKRETLNQSLYHNMELQQRLIKMASITEDVRDRQSLRFKKDIITPLPKIDIENENEDEDSIDQKISDHKIADECLLNPQIAQQHNFEYLYDNINHYHGQAKKNSKTSDDHRQTYVGNISSKQKGQKIRKRKHTNHHNSESKHGHHHSHHHHHHGHHHHKHKKEDDQHELLKQQKKILESLQLQQVQLQKLQENQNNQH